MSFMLPEKIQMPPDWPPEKRTELLRKLDWLTESIRQAQTLVSNRSAKWLENNRADFAQFIEEPNA